MLVSRVLCQNSWLGQFLQLAASITSWYFWVLGFVCSKPGCPPSIAGVGVGPPAGREEEEEEEDGSPLGRKDGCSLGALGFAVLGAGDELQVLQTAVPGAEH